ncbi:rubrerythrin [Kitasatospora sp. GP30]|uniref:hypothetical protein n=1 Tax=Kitasatospora sp. GP30 TaxID=3035084 RepID=UPI000C713339|nr:hypothetical protein [Kitasatospora sp. GP30]MDH6141905.1 rubrerythrin [Kitasatospora sp. GP30]
MADSNTEGEIRPIADPVGPERPERPREPAGPERIGGESACLLPLVCAECGALAEQRPPTVCRRCGAVVDRD